MSKIQKIELSCYGVSIFCPFCGQRVITEPDDNSDADIDSMSETNLLSPCPHTLFIATDEGFEYRSTAYDTAMGVEDSSAEATSEDNDETIDEYTNKLELRNSIKLALYVPPPSGLGAYVGFAPDALV